MHFITHYYNVQVGKYLAQSDVLARIGARGPWREFNPDVEKALESEYSKDVTPLIGGLLDAGVRVLVYSGQFDMICCALGTERWVNALEWKGAASFADASRVPWYGHGKNNWGGSTGGGQSARVTGAGGTSLAGYVQSDPSHMLTRFVKRTKLGVPLTMAAHKGSIPLTRPTVTIK
jgi:hypothetical protein